MLSGPVQHVTLSLGFELPWSPERNKVSMFQIPWFKKTKPVLLPKQGRHFLVMRPERKFFMGPKKGRKRDSSS